MEIFDEAFDVMGLTAVVTGASSGLGRRFAEVLGRSGVKVALAARRKDKLDEAVSEIGAADGMAMAVEMDVTDGASIRAAFDTVEDAFGVPTIIVNNAGVASTKRAIELTEADWDGTVDTNLKGAWQVATVAAQRMKEAKSGGTMINIASILGFDVRAGILPYVVSKAGLVQMTKAMALEWARYDIRVNAIAPGYIETDINKDYLSSPDGQALLDRIPQRRFGRPRDLDGVMMLLASDASLFMTGATIPVDGGHLVAGL